jgi:hypothetical protein
MSIFERIVAGVDVEAWTLQTLRVWSSTYIAELERQHGIDAGTLPRIRAWQPAPSMDKWPEDQLPTVVVMSLGTAERPLKDGDGTYRARWQINLACICSARREAEARANGMLYIAAHKALLLQRPSLGGNATGIDWLDEDYTQIAFDDQRTLFAPQAAFVVEVPDVVTTKAGPTAPDEPLEPDTDPWPDWPTVLTHQELVENFPVEEPLPQEANDASRS